MSRSSSAGRCSGAISRLKSVGAAALQATTRARNSRPSAVRTPVARPSAHQHLRHRRLRHDLHAEARAGARDRRRDGAHAAAHEAPAAGPLMLAHQVVHDHVRRAGGLRSCESPDRGVIREHALDDVVLEPGRQIVVGALRQQVDHPVGAIADRAMPPQQRGTPAEARPAASTGSTGVSNSSCRTTAADSSRYRANCG